VNIFTTFGYGKSRAAFARRRIRKKKVGSIARFQIIYIKKTKTPARFP
jgi:hypothetical protein